MQDYHQLEIWQRGMSYAVEIYKFSASLPADERYNLTQQIRRAPTSVPLNIAEGCGCSTDGEFVRCLGYEGDQISRMTRTLMQRLGGAFEGWTHS